MPIDKSQRSPSGPLQAAPAAEVHADDRDAKISSITGWLIFISACAGILLRLSFFEPEIARSPDERTYTRQANVLLEQGVSGLRTLGDELVRNPMEVGVAPSPVRVGYLGILAGYMEITGNRTVLAGAQLSLVANIATLILVAFAARRHLARTAAAITVLLDAVLPFELMTGRRAWQEAVISLLATALIVLAMELPRLRGVARLGAYLVFTIAGVLSLTTKENIGVAFLLCTAGLFGAAILRKDRATAVGAAVSLGAAILITAAILASIFGGLGKYVALQRIAENVSAMNVYDQTYSVGPAWMLPAAIVRVCPLVAIGALAGMVIAIYRSFGARSLSAAGLPLALAGYCIVLLLVQIVSERMNLRYTAPIYSSLCMLAGAGCGWFTVQLHRVMRPLGGLFAWTILSVVLGVAALRDVNFGRDYLLNTGMQDLALRPVLGEPPAQPSSSNPR
ncbi:hypothetical protein FTW19_09720 [Terriglobus albidus]|uniref:Glycosyltransferase RgtA/B/C/D-like domain-containing protein n=1 Tax=Terriglobus albidus TaxID=1592106 RepID=A0A5B9E7L3_9BACT|nr:hypothetical protein [Terriglobus albidus]QEE28253.1 hypothetical protein FTW19_09720 [Terriglobus albidus]